MLSFLALSAASSSRASRACQRACPGGVQARSHARYPGPSRRDAHVRRPEPSAFPRRMHRAQAGAACVPLQCAAAVCRLLTSAPRRGAERAVVGTTRVCSPAWCVLLEPTLRITRGLVARGAVAAVGGTRRWAVDGVRRWAVAGTCALSFFSMVLYWLTRADCDLETFFSPSSPVSAIRFSLTALAWTGQKGRSSSGTAGAGHHRSASLRRPRGGARLGRRRGQRRASGWRFTALPKARGPPRRPGLSTTSQCRKMASPRF